MIEIPPDTFDEFFALRAANACSDPRFNVRPIHHSEYECIFECIDEAFGVKRPPALYDWLYRKNPYGKARMWVLEEKSTGRVLKTSGRFPWPVWRGSEAHIGFIGGDSATRPEWQRKGLSHFLKEVRESHPWHTKGCRMSGPNENSRSVIAHRGETEKILGSLRGAVLPLRPAGVEGQSALGQKLADIANLITDGSVSMWQKLMLQSADSSSLQFSELSRFSSDFDRLTLKTMGFPGYWCPHSWEFLNWRYLDHPGEKYSAFVLSEGDSPVGYAVLRFSGKRATIAEFAVGSDAGHADRLLLELTKVAREAECTYLTFFATPAWRHWRRFHRAGMLPLPTKNYLEVVYDEGDEDVRKLQNWQILPGDRDYH